MKKALFLITSIILFSCSKHEDAKIYIITENCKTLSFQGDNGTIYNLNATKDTDVYLMAKTNENIQFSSSPINPLLPYKFDVYQNVNGVDMEILHVNSKSTGKFKTEK